MKELSKSHFERKYLASMLIIALFATLGCSISPIGKDTFGNFEPTPSSTSSPTTTLDPTQASPGSGATSSSTSSTTSTTPVSPDKFTQLESYIKTLEPDFIGTGANPETNTPQFPSQVLAIVTPDTAKVIGLGNLQNGRAPNGTDVYPISSMSKMLTGLILAQGVLNNEFNLNAPLKKLFKSKLQDGLTSETLEDAVTHYGSFLDTPQNLKVNSNNTYDPGQGYDVDSLRKCLLVSTCSRSGQPIGSQYLYSSLGTGLLGIGLQEWYGLSFEALLQAKVSQPLGLTATHASAANYGSGAYIVEGYTPDGTQVAPATMGVLAPAGAVLTNANDMITLLNVLLHPTGQWTAIIGEATSPLKPQVGYAIDILSREGMDFLSKSGDQAGYSSLILWNKKSGVGIAALTNRGKGSATIARELIAIHAKAAALYGP